MTKLLEELGTTFVAYFGITNPLANIPVFIALTAGCSAALAKKLALRALLVAFGIVLVVAVSGQLLFALFGISLPAVRITGGVILFIIGYKMLLSDGKAADIKGGDDEQSLMRIAVTPLGTPLLTGPGTISYTVAQSMNHDIGACTRLGVLLMGFVLMAISTYLLFIGSRKILKYLNETTLDILSRLMGFAIASIGIQLTVIGAQEVFPMLVETLS